MNRVGGLAAWKWLFILGMFFHPSSENDGRWRPLCKMQIDGRCSMDYDAHYKHDTQP
jgi:hypothetical protein